MENFILGLIFATLGLNILDGVSALFISFVERIKAKNNAKISEYNMKAAEYYSVAKIYAEDDNDSSPVITGFVGNEVEM